MAINLSFTRNADGMYEAATPANNKVSGNFNVHLEADKAGVATIYERTSGSAYARCDMQVEIKESDQEGVFCGEVDYFAAVFDKDIKIVSNVQVTSGIITVES